MDSFNFKKKFGQNFLKDKKIVSKIADVASITKDDLVIEVGPGKGILTRELAIRAKKVLAYEIDRELENDLGNLQEQYDNIDIIFDDFINRNILNDIKNYEYKNVFFVSNVPYYITTPILMKIMNEDILFSKIVMMIQKEVGDRFSAMPGSKSYSSITVYLNYYYDIKKEFYVDRNEFVPIPNVDSVVVSFTTKDKLFLLDNKELFFKLVRDSFQFKRKNIKNNLSNYDLSIVDRVLNENGFSLTSRAEQIPLKVYVILANSLNSSILTKKN